MEEIIGQRTLESVLFWYGNISDFSFLNHLLNTSWTPWYRIWATLLLSLLAILECFSNYEWAKNNYIFNEHMCKVPYLSTSMCISFSQLIEVYIIIASCILEIKSKIQKATVTCLRSYRNTGIQWQSHVLIRPKKFSP